MAHFISSQKFQPLLGIGWWLIIQIPNLPSYKFLQVSQMNAGSAK